jgi:pimeloyl-ACP methyl ester carboxylesterase
MHPLEEPLAEGGRGAYERCDMAAGKHAHQDFAIAGRRIEAAWYGPSPDQMPTLVLLHEGLGCVGMWRDFPQRLAERTGYGVFAYSRPGYGASDAAPRPATLEFMDQEASEVLGPLLDAAGIRKALLVGQSDGASIATIYAGSVQDFRVRGLVLIAPHFFREDVTLNSIVAAKKDYEAGDLRARLARYHVENVDSAFSIWNNGWLGEGADTWNLDDALAHIRVPMLIIQGVDDQYGTLAQLRRAEEVCYCPVETLVLQNCRHSPQFEQPEATLDAIADFAGRVLAPDERSGPSA